MNWFTAKVMRHIYPMKVQWHRFINQKMRNFCCRGVTKGHFIFTALLFRFWHTISQVWYCWGEFFRSSSFPLMQHFPLVFHWVMHGVFLILTSQWSNLSLSFLLFLCTRDIRHDKAFTAIVNGLRLKNRYWGWSDNQVGALSTENRLGAAFSDTHSF